MAESLSLGIRTALRKRGYHLREYIGEGGHCIVWRAVQVEQETRKAVAVKISRQILVSQNEATGEESAAAKELARFPQIKSEIRHPHIVELYDYFVVPEADEGTGQWVVSVWEYCDTDLNRERRAISEHQCLAYLYQAAEAIDYLRKLGFQHRDIKPANILIVRAERSAKLGDLGLTKLLSSGPPTASGTPGIAPPERYAGRENASEDLYSLAVTYAFLRTGSFPFGEWNTGESIMRVVGRQADARLVEDAVRNIDTSTLSPAEQDLLIAALHPDPAQRFSGSAMEWIEKMMTAHRSLPVPTHQEMLDHLLSISLHSQLKLIAYSCGADDKMQMSWPTQYGERCQEFLRFAEAKVGLATIWQVFLEVKGTPPLPATPSAPTEEMPEDLGLTDDVQRDLVRCSIGLSFANVDDFQGRDLEVASIVCAKRLARELRDLAKEVVDEAIAFETVIFPNWRLTSVVPQDATSLIVHGLRHTIAAREILRLRQKEFKKWRGYSELLKELYEALDVFYGGVVSLVSQEATRSRSDQPAQSSNSPSLGISQEMSKTINAFVDRGSDLQNVADLFFECHCQRLATILNQNREEHAG